MKKMIKKLTFMDIHKVCITHINCNNCPLCYDRLCIVDIKSSEGLVDRYKELLNRRIKL